MELENLQRENDKLKHELATVYKLQCTFCNLKTPAYISLSSHVNRNHDNKMSIERENLLEEQSVAMENSAVAEDHLSKNEEEHLDSQNAQHNSDYESWKNECDTCSKMFASKD